jgi:hypothetical protein
LTNRPVIATRANGLIAAVYSRLLAMLPPKNTPIGMNPFYTMRRRCSSYSNHPRRT